MGYTMGNFYFFVAYTTSGLFIMVNGSWLNLLVVNWVNWLISVKEKKEDSHAVVCV